MNKNTTFFTGSIFTRDANNIVKLTTVDEYINHVVTDNVYLDIITINENGELVWSDYIDKIFTEKMSNEMFCFRSSKIPKTDNPLYIDASVKKHSLPIYNKYSGKIEFKTISYIDNKKFKNYILCGYGKNNFSIFDINEQKSENYGFLVGMYLAYCQKKEFIFKFENRKTIDKLTKILSTEDPDSIISTQELNDIFSVTVVNSKLLKQIKDIYVKKETIPNSDTNRLVKYLPINTISDPYLLENILVGFISENSEIETIYNEKLKEHQSFLKIKINSFELANNFQYLMKIKYNIFPVINTHTHNENNRIYNTYELSIRITDMVYDTLLYAESKSLYTFDGDFKEEYVFNIKHVEYENMTCINISNIKVIYENHFTNHKFNKPEKKMIGFKIPVLTGEGIII